MIASVHWPKPMISMLSTVFPSIACFNFHWQYNSQERLTKILTMLPRLLTCT